MEKLHEYKEKISIKLEKYEKIVEIEKQTGVDKFYIFLVGVALTGILLFVVGGENLIVNLVGFIYPAYMSFKAISSNTINDDTQWLTYWVVYAFFNITESITDILFSWVPFYFFLKIGFLVWCYHPSTLGAEVIYSTVIKPYIAPHVQTIDAALKPNEKKN